MGMQYSSDSSQIDSLLQDVIQAYESAFPGRIVAYYLEGSYVDQTYLSTSDIDVVIVFREKFTDEETRQAVEHVWASRQTGAQEVDIAAIDEESLRSGVRPNLKLGGQLIYGQDVCSAYPILPVEIWARERMHAAYWLLVKVYRRPTPVRLPLDFPLPTDEFYGYTQRTIRLPDGQEVPCTRNLVRTTGWAATALLAHQAGQYAGRKRDCAWLYRKHIGDEWSSLLDEIAHFCREEWQYLIPEDPQAREHLREICGRVLRFEQHFLSLYKPFLLGQIRSQDIDAFKFARWIQEKVPFDNLVH